MILLMSRARFFLPVFSFSNFLVAQPYSIDERTHNVVMAVGNGLGADIWHEFMARFNIKTINEFYASSEGNCNLVNSENVPKACGFLPSGVARLLFPVNIIKCNEETMEPRIWACNLKK